MVNTFVWSDHPRGMGGYPEKLHCELHISYYSIVYYSCSEKVCINDDLSNAFVDRLLSASLYATWVALQYNC